MDFSSMMDAMVKLRVAEMEAEQLELFMQEKFDREARGTGRPPYQVKVTVKMDPKTGKLKHDMVVKVPASRATPPRPPTSTTRRAPAPPPKPKRREPPTKLTVAEIHKAVCTAAEDLLMSVFGIGDKAHYLHIDDDCNISLFNPKDLKLIAEYAVFSVTPNQIYDTFSEYTSYPYNMYELMRRFGWSAPKGFGRAASERMISQPDKKIPFATMVWLMRAYEEFENFGFARLQEVNTIDLNGATFLSDPYKSITYKGLCSIPWEIFPGLKLVDLRRTGITRLPVKFLRRFPKTCRIQFDRDRLWFRVIEGGGERPPVMVPRGDITKKVLREVHPSMEEIRMLERGPQVDVEYAKRTKKKAQRRAAPKPKDGDLDARGYKYFNGIWWPPGFSAAKEQKPPAPKPRGAPRTPASRGWQHAKWMGV